MKTKRGIQRQHALDPRSDSEERDTARRLDGMASEGRSCRIREQGGEARQIDEKEALLESNIATQGHVITGIERFDIPAIPPNVPLKRKVPLVDS
tara:strand:- start:1939 stop:2223 length:285 start_codon:yes stop_codon:yes gene_type:complete